jgi:hypothetical protein
MAAAATPAIGSKPAQAKNTPKSAPSVPALLPPQAQQLLDALPQLAGGARPDQLAAIISAAASAATTAAAAAIASGWGTRPGGSGTAAPATLMQLATGGFAAPAWGPHSGHGPAVWAPPAGVTGATAWGSPHSPTADRGKHGSGAGARLRASGSWSSGGDSPEPEPQALDARLSAAFHSHQGQVLAGAPQHQGAGHADRSAAGARVREAALHGPSAFGPHSTSSHVRVVKLSQPVIVRRPGKPQDGSGSYNAAGQPGTAAELQGVVPSPGPTFQSLQHRPFPAGPQEEEQQQQQEGGVGGYTRVV